jgi:hypothetical protein
VAAGRAIRAECSLSEGFISRLRCHSDGRGGTIVVVAKGRHPRLTMVTRGEGPDGGPARLFENSASQQRRGIFFYVIQEACGSTFGPCRLVMPTKVGIHAFCPHNRRRGWRACARHDGWERPCPVSNATRMRPGDFCRKIFHNLKVFPEFSHGLQRPP